MGITKVFTFYNVLSMILPLPCPRYSSTGVPAPGLLKKCVRGVRAMRCRDW